MLELSKQFRFDAAHTLECEIEADASRRIHGHSYRAEVTVTGTPDPKTGMIIDLKRFERALADARQALDHHMLDYIPNLGPATLENLCVWIWNRLAPSLPGMSKVMVARDSSGDGCVYRG
jgi:6-pyruvoyltetrahydropterin/6-carboxytetrahydropterin synthase